MFWIFLIGLIVSITGMIISIKNKKKTLIIVFSVMLCLVLFTFVTVILPGLLFAMSSWQF